MMLALAAASLSACLAAIVVTVTRGVGGVAGRLGHTMLDVISGLIVARAHGWHFLPPSHGYPDVSSIFNLQALQDTPADASKAAPKDACPPGWTRAQLIGPKWSGFDQEDPVKAHGQWSSEIKLALSGTEGAANVCLVATQNWRVLLHQVHAWEQLDLVRPGVYANCTRGLRSALVRPQVLPPRHTVAIHVRREDSNHLVQSSMNVELAMAAANHVDKALPQQRHRLTTDAIAQKVTSVMICSDERHPAHRAALCNSSAVREGVVCTTSTQDLLHDVWTMMRADVFIVSYSSLGYLVGYLRTRPSMVVIPSKVIFAQPFFMFWKPWKRPRPAPPPNVLVLNQTTMGQMISYLQSGAGIERTRVFLSAAGPAPSVDRATLGVEARDAMAGLKAGAGRRLAEGRHHSVEARETSQRLSNLTMPVQMVDCDTPTYRAFSREQRAEMEHRAHQWMQTFGGKLLQSISEQNLPSNGSRESARWRPPFNEIGWLQDRGCFHRSPPDVFGRSDRHAFNLWKPAVASSCPGAARSQAVSNGARSICALSAHAKRPDCVIFSVGSHGDFAFENHLLERTSHCEMHTFDCTMGSKWAATRKMKPRLTFHPWCLAAQSGQPGPAYKTLGELAAIVAGGMGAAPNGSVMPPSLVKMDIEGFERAILLGWRSEDEWLPEQLFTEIHCYVDSVSHRIRFLSEAEQAVLLAHMHTIGYRLVDLLWEGGGVSATFVRAKCPLQR